MGPALRRRRAATYVTAPNIAHVKYWGMRDVERGLPWNSSFSVTLDRLRTRTTVRFDESLTEDRFLLNGEIEAGPPLQAVHAFLDKVRGLARLDAPAEVVSTNNFQAASGLASSASGFAALAGAATAAAGLRLTPRELSRLARLGSGSAARSVFGGFVEWRAGTSKDGRDCFAQPIFGPDHWPELVDVVALIHEAPEKSIRSADAMQLSVRTSPRYAARLKNVAARLSKVRAAVRRRDGAALFALIIEECDEFREVCETTDPPFDYLTSVSREILERVLDWNREVGHPVAGYTHDAGAHVHVFTTARRAAELKRRLGAVEGIEKVLTLKPGVGGRLEGAATAG